jgi:hypothetical protein
MALRAVEHVFNGATAPDTAYDSTKNVIGDLIKLYSGSGARDTYAGPVRFGRDASLTTYYGVARPNETSTAVPGIYPHVKDWADKRGYYSTGTVAVSGTAVTGTGTGWLTNGVPINATIGFGSTNPSEITTWYVISAIPSNTSITLQSTAGTISAGTSFVIKKSYQIDWVFLADNATAAATRRITLFQYDRYTSAFTWRGFVTMTYPAATNHTIVGMRAVYATYTTGTVAVSGATVTGTSTAWSTSRINIGSRIGFGSTDPTQISQWYYINAVGSDTSITIQVNVTAAGTGGTAANITVSAGASYVIEDLKILTTTTNATATNGGLFMVMGLSYDDFTTTGTTIAAATTVDKVKACYWLADASTVTNDVASGCALDDFDSWTQQYCYVIERQAATTPAVYKYNFRTALASITSGKTTSAFVLATGIQTVTGNVSQTNNGRIGTLAHGPGSGVKCLYYATTTRIYRAAISSITSGSTTWNADNMVEVPTGGTSTYNASSVLSSVEISDQIDRLIVIGTGAGTIPANNRAFITQYNTTSTPFDMPFLIDTRQIDQSTASNDICPAPSPQGAVLSVWSQGGLLYIARTGTTSLTNQLYAIPIGADWNFAGGTVKQRLITPAISTPNATKYKRIYVNHEQYSGGGALQLPTEGHRVYYRTAGISDDSGSWTLIDDSGDIGGASASSEIQFMFEFRVIGTFCIPGRIFNITCTYEDNTTDSHYQPSVAQSDKTNKIFAWRFSTAFGGTVPTLRIRLYNAVTGGLLLDDTTTSSASGTWEKSTNDGGAWGAYDTSDKANDTTYIRYTPTTLGDNIKVRALLTQN